MTATSNNILEFKTTSVYLEELAQYAATINSTLVIKTTPQKGAWVVKISNPESGKSITKISDTLGKAAFAVHKDLINNNWSIREPNKFGRT